MGRKEEIEERTRMEMEIGQRRALVNAILDDVSGGDHSLRKAFPNLGINTKIPYPYEFVIVTIFKDTELVYEGIDPLEGFPSDELVAKLALIA